MKAEPQGSGLPAPYRSPWRALWDDLAAVAAWLRLKLWELARLNREGALPLPPRWPPRLAALFWPLVLLLALAAVTLLGGRLLSPPSSVRSPGLSEPPIDLPATTATLPSPPPQGGQELPSASPPEPVPAPTVEPPAAAPAVAPQAPDPLLRQLGPEGEVDPLLAAVETSPAEGVLRLRVAAGFGRLSGADRQARAEQWQQRAGRLGYERLELLDGEGRPLGRSAVVGSGMILLDPDPSA